MLKVKFTSEEFEECIVTSNREESAAMIGARTTEDDTRRGWNLRSNAEGMESFMISKQWQLLRNDAKRRGRWEVYLMVSDACFWLCGWRIRCGVKGKGRAGFEPTTTYSVGRHSIQLN